jgi:large subunit ribosomal protein L24
MVGRQKMHVKKGDTVMVTTGKEKGKSGKVLTVYPEKASVIVEKVNFIKKHSRPTQKAPKGGIIEKEGRLHVSKVTIVCPKCNRPVRIRNNRLDDGKRVRACARCGEILDQ